MTSNSKYRFENQVEFHINNICTLTCGHCNTFSNHRFTGWQDWQDYEAIYQRWAEYIELPRVAITGGEPLLNGSLNSWVTGLHKFFGSSIQILSNGLLLNRQRALYEVLAATGAHVAVSLHDLQNFDRVRINMVKFLGQIKEEYGAAVGRDLNPGVYYSIRDHNDVLINVYLSRPFMPSAVISRSDGSRTLHQSVPESAHKICTFAQLKKYQFVHGKLYKCGPVALLPEFDQQLPLDISDQDRQLLNSYRPMTVDLWPTHGTRFVSKLNRAIDQCKFCSATFDIK